MARIYPKIASSDIYNSELKVYNALSEQLDDSFWVFHSLAYLIPGKDNSILQGEADFFVIHPDYGILVLEIKGGKKITYNAEEKSWYSISFGGTEYLIKDPFLQGQKNIFNLVDKIRTVLNLPKKVSLPFSYGYAAVFPDVVIPAGSTFPSHALPELIIDNKDLTAIAKRIISIFKHWGAALSSSKISGNELHLIIDNILLPQFELVRPLWVQMKDEENMIIRLTERQYQILNRNMKENSRAIIKGYAGTGKTLLALMKARELALSGKSVLYLCYNSQLASSLKLAYQQQHLNIATYHSFARDLIRQFSSSKFPANPDQNFWDSGIADILFDVISFRKIKYDAILVDEAQDFKENWWTSLEMLLNEDSHYYIFYDPKQNIYSSGMALPKLPATLPLIENCRNTVNINDVIKRFGNVDIETSSQCPNGEEVFFQEYCNQDHMIEILKDVIKKLKKDFSLSSGDIVLLSPKSYENCIFSKYKFNFFGYNIVKYANSKPQENTLYYESLYSFKGLESKAVVIFGIDENEEASGGLSLYVASSRAKHLLFILHHEKRSLFENK